MSTHLEKGSFKSKFKRTVRRRRAGTFSDGKLNTMVHDRNGYLQQILETFVRCGAPEEILYLNKPHLGTDQLKKIIPKLRREIISLGGEFRFESTLQDIQIESGKIQPAASTKERFLLRFWF